MLAVSIDLQHSYCDIVFLIIQFKLCLYIFCTTFKGYIFNNRFLRKYNNFFPIHKKDIL